MTANRFQELLDFEVLSTNNPTIVSDGTVVIEINTDRYARAGVKLFSPDWKEMVLELEKITKVIKITDGFELSPMGKPIPVDDVDHIKPV